MSANAPTPSRRLKKNKSNIPRHSKTLKPAPSNKYHKSQLPRNIPCGKCVICNKTILALTGEPRQYPKAWPDELQVYYTQDHDDDDDDDDDTNNKELAHRKCLSKLQNLRTEYVSGAIHERWSKAPKPLGSPRAERQIAQRRRRKQIHTSSKTKPFNSAVRPPLMSSLGTQISRPSDSLHLKTRVIPQPPPKPIPFQHRKIAQQMKKSQGSRATTPQLQVMNNGKKGKKKKITVRVVFS
tara:strand:- start:384 stop:1100 length:717 start_codon:yes stop_codon:yes gene_type:complete